jgi:hypothetical protein
LDKAVPCSGASRKWYSAVCGRYIEYDRYVGSAISVYLPQDYSRNEKFNADFRTTEWYSAAGWQAAGW